jgi:hypothetical protein
MTRRIVLALWLPALLPAEDAFAVVTQKSNTGQITKAQLKGLIVGQSEKWPGGKKITLFLGPAGEPSRVAALKQLANMSESEFNAKLIQLAFTGQNDAQPRALPSTSAVRHTVQAVAGSVGIIPVAEVDDTVTRLTI